MMTNVFVECYKDKLDSKYFWLMDIQYLCLKYDLEWWCVTYHY